jgi:hypothetical protein
MIIKSPCCLFICFLFLLCFGQRAASQDSIPVKKDSVKTYAIEAPIITAAKDSMVMVKEGGNKVYFFGEASINYQNKTLEGEYIELDADSSIIFATYGLDSIGEKIGYPVFKEGETQREMNRVRYNFKTQKMFISDIITQEGEGYITAGTTKRMPNEDLFMKDGKYTTCDEHDHQHFYLKITKLKLRPGKNAIFGPAYLVVEDVPLPIAIPFGFFPFSKDYSSGIIMPTYGDEMTRGFSLRDGGYYLALSKYADLKLTGELFTKGSWGLNAASTYKKIYKFSGSINAGYMVTVTGDKETKGMENSDYSVSKDFKLTWSHNQDPKSNPFSTVSASINFSTSSYDRNNLTSIYDPQQYSQNTKASSINYRYKHPSIPVSINANASINQISKDTTLSLTLPNVSISVSQFYPFKRKEQIGDQKWYEKIYMSYSGLIANRIDQVHESEFLKKNVIRDWKNGMKHDIPISASFNLFKYITISPSVNYSESWYTKKVDYRYDYDRNNIVPSDTSYGFYRVYNYNASVSAGTKLYGTYKPWSLLGEWTKGVSIRHVLTPSVSFSGAPDFSDPKYGMYKKIQVYKQVKGSLQSEQQIDDYFYSPFQNQMWGAPSRGKSGAMNFSLDNNLEMKIPVHGSDSISDRKISLIDNLGLRMSYNFLADSMNWSNLSASVRIKLFGTTLSLQGNFDTYLYDENGRHINVPRWKAGKGIGRFMGTSTGYSYTLSNDVIKKWFSKDKNKNAAGSDGSSPDNDSENMESGAESSQTQAQTSLRQPKQSSGEYDEDGYLLLDIPWSLSFNYSASLMYDMQNFDKIKREYPYKISQTVGISGNISPTKGWSFNFSTSYDFDYKRFATMNCSISRQMHCWSMSASVIPIGPYQSYSFSIAVNSSLLQDLKYNQSSNSRDALNWGNR